MHRESTIQQQYTGHPFYLTQRQHDGLSSVHLHYLLPNNITERVTIDEAHDTPLMREAIGQALAAGRRTSTY